MELPAELQHHDAHIQDAVTAIYNRQHLHGQTSVKKAAQAIVSYTRSLVEKKASNTTIFDHIEQARVLLVNADTRHARIKNALRFMIDHDFYLIEEGGDLVSYLDYKYKQLLTHLHAMHDTCVELGMQKLRSGMDIFVYGYSSEIVEMISHFIHMGHELTVWTAEAKPLYAGRQLADQLSQANIAVNYVADSHIRHVIKKCALCFINGEAIDHNEQVYAIIGSELVCDIAEKYHVPVYCMVDGWQYDPEKVKNEHTQQHIDEKTVWDTYPSHTTIHALAFEKVEGKLISGIISEMGITSTSAFLDGLHDHYPDLF